ncbi:glutathione S-transferase family protein [Polyangium jinanense]|uniref:glutathione S-transferase family protein n=1 Tax=Polyangium jinanense TaxID=2829994 RepID=UPI002340867D|nr:glutathione S-transferase family protein [Polyangium jinanense]MDC3962660.1 glutathione S-transferase family protein [Polyangium jinanense]
MAIDSSSPIEITAFKWVPEIARGQVRDLRVRWALEEVGQRYEVQYLVLGEHKQPPHRARQPFGQVPTYQDSEVTLFESGAIVLHIAERFEGLLSDNPAARARAIQWMFTALNTIEPPLTDYFVTIFEAGKPWSEPRRAAVEARVHERLGELSQRLGDRQWLDGGGFTAGDLLMVTVLRIVEGKGLVEQYDNLAAYMARGIARPGFKKALADQLAGFAETPPPEASAWMEKQQQGKRS